MMNALMRRMDELAARENATRVTRIRVWLGALSHMSPEHFHEHFAASSAGSVAEGARLDIECSNDIDHPDAQEIRLASIEVEDS